MVAQKQENFVRLFTRGTKHIKAIIIRIFLGSRSASELQIRAQGGQDEYIRTIER